MSKNELKKILEHAVKTTSYYEKYRTLASVDKTLEQFDVLTKEKLVANKNEIVSKDLAERYGLGEIEISRTSGSTGVFTDVLWAKSDILKSNKYLWKLRHKWYGITSLDKYVSFARSYKIGNTIKKPPKYQIIGNNLQVSKFEICDQTLLECFEKMDEFEPVWMIVQPSILKIIMTALRTNSKKLCSSIKYIELNGEYVAKNDEKMFKDFFKVSISNMYGAYEVNCIGYECPCGNMHVLEKNVYLSRSKNKVLVTSLTNYLMPIIKYDLCDDFEYAYKKCSCGMSGQCITIHRGRSTDYISISGAYISPYFIVFSIEEVNMLLNNIILSYKIIQLKSVYDINIYLTIDKAYENWKNVIMKEVLESIHKNDIVSILNYNILFVDRIYDLHFNDKYKFFEREI